MTTFCGDGVMYLLCLDVVDVAIGVKDCYDSIVIGSKLGAGIYHCLLDDGNIVIGSACGSCNDGGFGSVTGGIGVLDAYRTRCQHIVVVGIGNACQSGCG